MNRRKYLRTAVVFSIPLISGCTSNLPFGSSGRANLGDITAINFDTKQHTLHVIVEEEDQLVHWSSYHLEPTEQEGYTASLKNTWGGNDVRETLYARRDRKSSWEKTDLSNLPEGATFDFDIGIQENGEITFAMSPVNKS